VPHDRDGRLADLLSYFGMSLWLCRACRFSGGSELSAAETWDTARHGLASCRAFHRRRGLWLQV